STHVAEAIAMRPVLRSTATIDQVAAAGVGNAARRTGSTRTARMTGFIINNGVSSLKSSLEVTKHVSARPSSRRHATTKTRPASAKLTARSAVALAKAEDTKTARRRSGGLFVLLCSASRVRINGA